MRENVNNLDHRWSKYIETAWIDELDQSTFLLRCANGKVTRVELMHFLVQQYHYAKEFTRYLCALLSNIENEDDRRALTENLIDETGLGIDKGIPHSRLYRNMMARMGVDASTAPDPATIALSATMLESCKSANAAIGLGALCLGAEAVVPHVYAIIVKGFERYGYTKEELDFFYLHIGCDDEHALTMKGIIDREIQDQRQAAQLRASARRIIAARARFFNAISNSVLLAQDERHYDAVL